MVKRILALFLVAGLLLAFSTSTFAWGEVKKAKEFMAAKMFHQAVAILEKQIIDKPTDTEAHYQLGICYINQQNFSGADERFASAVALDSEYGHKIGDEWKKAGDSAFSSGSDNQASGLYAKAIQYQPNLRSGIVQSAFSQGKTYLAKGKYDFADSKFRVATSLDSSISGQISTMYFELGNKADEDNCVGFYDRAAHWDSGHNKQIGERYLAISKSEEKKAEIQKWRKEAAKYIKVPPDYKIYQPGKYSFILNSGEFTDQYIMFPPGKYRFDITSDINDFELYFDDGEVILSTADKVPKKSRYKFKVKALGQRQIFQLIVKKK